MPQKFIIIISIAVCSVFISESKLYSQSSKFYKNIFLDGSESGAVNKNYETQENTPYIPIQPLKTNSYVVYYTSLGLASYYDVQSNATPNEIWQDPLNPLYVHAAVMVQPNPGGTRYVNYFLSTDRGLTWDNFGNVTESQSGFPSIDGLSDGSAIITMQTKAGGLTAERSQVFVDLGSGFGTFNRLDPGIVNGNSQIWGRILATGNLLNPVKFILANSSNVTNNSSTTTGSSVIPLGTFSPWINYGSATAEQYCFALAENGKIGNAFISKEIHNQGDVQFRESKDNGLTWSSVTTIFNADIPVDSLGAFRGISMVYLRNSPCVTFEVAHITPYYMTAPGIYPRKPSYIYFWSPAVNGGAAKRIAGPENVPFYPNTGPEASYGGYTPLCRPAIGKANSSSSAMLFIAMNAATSSVSADSNVYYATYYIESYDSGNNWWGPERITPVTPLKDYRYVSISRTSSLDNIDFRWNVQMTVQTHEYAGAFAPDSPPGPSDFLAMRLVTGIISDEISIKKDKNYKASDSEISLKENYPNPFNPRTLIRFEISRPIRVTLDVFSVSGQKVAALINNEFTSAGLKEVTFDGSDLSSGIYFYTLTAGEFRETGRMLLIK